MTATYVALAVTAYASRLARQDSLASRPVRLDGFSLTEIKELVPALQSGESTPLVRVLTGTTNEQAYEINAERATRYRNQVDASGRRQGFVLLVPLGQVVESSLDEPAFMVVPRSKLFHQALSRLMMDRTIGAKDLHAIREAAIFRQSESLYAFLSSWEPGIPTEPLASHSHLGLLADRTATANLEGLAARLHLNREATDILLRPGVSESRTLDELVSKVGLDAEPMREGINELQRWWHGGKSGRPPASLFMDTWKFVETDLVEIRWEKDLSAAPHAGFRIVNEVVEADATGSSTVEWLVVHKTAATRFELDLVEALTLELVKPIGKTKLPRRKIIWATLLRDEDVQERLAELNPAGAQDGYLFRVRLRVLDGGRWLEQLWSNPFAIDIDSVPPPALEILSPAPTAYHAVYEYHARKAIEPSVVGLASPLGSWPTSVLLRAGDGKEKEARLDVGTQMLEIEAAVLSNPDLVGPWGFRARGNGADIVQAQGAPVGWHLEDFLGARRAFFGAIQEVGSIEAADLRGPARVSATQYVARFEELLKKYVEHARTQGGVAAADRQHLSLILSSDSVQVWYPSPDGGKPLHVLLILPTHPVSVSWLLGFQDEIHAWTRGRFDENSKPPYRADRNTPAVLGGVESFAVGPRVMVLSTPLDADTPQSWGFAGNLTATWQCFVPVGPTSDIRSRDWATSLVTTMGLTPRPVGSGRMDAARIGQRIKKYAVLHPYASQLKIASVAPGDGIELLDALRVMDEKSGTPPGAQSIKEIRYEVTLIGPESERFGSAVDELTLNPGDDRWRRHAAAILDNPETVLSPGFAYAKRPLRLEPSYGAFEMWKKTAAELANLGEDGLHITLLGPMLATSVGSAPAVQLPSGFRNSGLAARPSARRVKAVGDSPFEGNWLLALNVPSAGVDSGPLKTARELSAAVDVAHGIVDPNQQVGLEVALSGPVSHGLQVAHQVSDWVIIADPLFSIELLDRAHVPGDIALLLDFTPEFEPYPGGRVVVTTQYLREVQAIGSAVGVALSSSGMWTTILASISARLLLDLANPTKQVVHGLVGLALSRTHIEMANPGSLVIPVDRHEDMFVFPKLGSGRILADLVALSFEDGLPVFDVVESKWSTKANLTAQVRHGVKQAATTAEVLRAAYFGYQGVDRGVRGDNLREVVTFHAARASRHNAPGALSDEHLAALASPMWMDRATVRSSVLAWCPDGSFGSDAEEVVDDVRVLYFGADAIAAHDAALQEWPESRSLKAATTDGLAPVPSDALTAVIDDTLESDLQERAAREIAIPTSDISDIAARSPTRGLPGEARNGSPDADTTLADTRTTGPLSPEAPPGDQDVAIATVHTPRRAQPIATGCLRLGSVPSTGRDALWCPPDLSNGHLIIVGGSGSGKTTALRHIAGEIAAHVPVLIVDFHGDIEIPGHEQAVYTFEYAGNSMFVNPFHLDAQFGSTLSPSRLKWEFLEAWRAIYPTMGVHQTNFLASLIEDAYASAGVTDNPETWDRTVTFGDVLSAFERSEASDSLRAKIESYMKQFLEWKIFHGSNAINVESFLTRTVRLDLSQLYENARNILADVVLRRLFLLVRALGPLPSGMTGWDKFRVYVVIDEAQILMRSSSDAKASLARYAAEARKFGIGLILATQLRDNVPADIWGNIDTRLFMQALDHGERGRNAKAANVPEGMLRSLTRGEAILTSSSKPDAPPVVVKIEPSWMGSPPEETRVD